MILFKLVCRYIYIHTVIHFYACVVLGFFFCMLIFFNTLYMKVFRIPISAWKEDVDLLKAKPPSTSLFGLNAGECCSG